MLFCISLIRFGFSSAEVSCGSLINMKALLLAVVLLSGCSLFDDIGQITFRGGVDAGTDVSMDVAEDLNTEDLDAEGDGADGADVAVIDVGEGDVQTDISEDVVDDVVVVTGCALNGCSVSQYCDQETNECAPSGPCATAGCPGGLVCDYRGQCVTCANDDECGSGALCEGVFCRCVGPQNFCSNPSVRDNACVESTSIEACGSQCQTCPAPPDFAVEVCGANGCDFQCNDGFVKRNGACVQAGIFCANPGGSIGGVCDPVAQTGCGAGQNCSVRAISANSFERVCVLASPLPVALEGESCIGSTGKVCEATHACVLGLCRRYCDMANAAGCMDTQYCAPALAPTPGLGFCNNDCSLID